MTTRITTDNITDATIGTADLASSVPLNTQWQSVVTADGSTGLTAVAGRGYFIDTTSGTITVTLPASPNIGDTISIRDYNGTFGTNNVTLGRNSSNIGGVAADGTLSTNNSMTTLVYIDSTKGWTSIENESKSSAVPPAYVTATGGTVTTSGDFKIHSFTGDGCFVVSCAGNIAGSNQVSYLVLAGGGGSAHDGAGGGGAGGFREGKSTDDSYTASPLATTGLPVSVTTYPVTVGAGGSAVSPGPVNPGSNSVFSTITSAGGGGAGTPVGGSCGQSGGSGGGGRANTSATGAAGNTPPVSPPQGNPGGPTAGPGPNPTGGGGGGASTAGSTGGPAGGNGGNGVASSITGSPVTRGGGGGGAQNASPSGGPSGSGGPGGGGNGAGGSHGTSGSSGTANTGGGGGGGSGPGSPGGSGGKGIVIIRYKYQN